MAGVGGALRETLAAHGALVRLLTRVGPDVFHQHRLQPERLVAETALERLLSQVQRHVAAEILSKTEGFATHVA